MNIVEALQKLKADLLDFIITNLQNKADINHTHTASDFGGSVSGTVYDLTAQGTTINENEDLNNYTTEGIYSAIASVANTLSNCPATTGFKLIVERGYSGTSRIIQTLKLGSSSNIEFSRQQINGEWCEWRRPLTNTLHSADYGESLPAAGTPGRIFFKKV